ncbi:MAG TPA: hypothetical protein VHE35_33470, partial [Kofleriaceae bacterium]|nr:hypothetical protein [Kofleriaceae bacterium]
HRLGLGGIGVNDDPTSTGNVAAVPGGAGAPPWQPAGVDIARGRYGARGLPAELLTYHPESRSFTRSEVGANGPALRTEASASPVAYPGGALAIVGGRTMNGSATDLVEAIHATDGTVAGTVGGRARVGATVTMLPSGDAIVFGGDLASDQASVRAVDHLTGLAATPAVDAGPSDTAAMNRAYHAAALLVDHVIVYGGLHLGSGGVEDSGPAALAARVSNTSLAATALETGAAEAVAYPDAIALQDGGVLAAGGARPGGACARTVVCPSAQSVRFEVDGSGPFASPAGALGVARYGERLTRLPDGTVLVTGGFVVDPADSTRLRATAIVETFEAHRAADDPLADLMITRTPGDVARDNTGAPLAECARIGAAPAPAVDAAADAP